MQNLHFVSKLFKTLELNLVRQKREIQYLNRALRFRQYLDGFFFFFFAVGSVLLHTVDADKIQICYVFRVG